MVELAYRTYLQPRGVVAEAIEFEPFSFIEAGSVGGIYLTGANFDPLRVKEDSMLTAMKAAPAWRVSVGISGSAVFAPEPNDSSEAKIFAAEELAAAVDEGIGQAKQFLVAAVIVLSHEETPAEVLRAFIDEDWGAFCEFVQGHIFGYSVEILPTTA